ncbi:hypothetical protein [Thermoactinospora rubra]|uniref:hypothetical protein n=1 Tax=Thermoactinospora rubra TaxID=1088767 RepID=UPI00117CB7E2|nr:hypothetical protein [Thermoactinospora rubra]
MAVEDHVMLTIEQAGSKDPEPQVLAKLRAEYPEWKIRTETGIWCATGPCPLLACGCTRTLHAPDLEGLGVQLRGCARRDR